MNRKNSSRTLGQRCAKKKRLNLRCTATCNCIGSYRSRGWRKKMPPSGWKAAPISRVGPVLCFMFVWAEGSVDQPTHMRRSPITRCFFVFFPLVPCQRSAPPSRFCGVFLRTPVGRIRQDVTADKCSRHTRTAHIDSHAALRWVCPGAQRRLICRKGKCTTGACDGNFSPPAFDQ